MHDLFHLLATLIYIEILLILVRVLISWFPGIDPWNPLVRALRMVVDPVLAPFRRILPTFSGIDLSPILAIVVLDQVRAVLERATGTISVTSALYEIIARLILDIIIAFIIIVALRLVMSMFRADPFHPMVRLVRDLSSPLVRPFATALPRSRAIDTAALVAFCVFLAAYFVASWALGRIHV